MFAFGLFKRFLPFLLTFAAGLFIASFFVSVTAPSFKFGRDGGKRRHDCKRVRVEIQNLREENSRLRDEIEQLRRNPINLDYVRPAFDLPADSEVPPPPPPPPSVRRAPKHYR
jgi:hypothetical protein